MNLLAVVSSLRKGKSTDKLVNKAIEGALSKNPDINVKKIYLSDYKIGYCKNCLTCRDSKTAEPYAICTIRDDMDILVKDIHDSDLLIWGTPIHMGYIPSILMTFIERFVWLFAKPEGKHLTLTNCPTPRSNKKRKSITIITNGIVPPIYRMFCDEATHIIKETVKETLNGDTLGSLYAGAIEKRGVECYLDKAYKLGMKLV